MSDISGLIEDFDAGCGDGERQTNGEPFTYLPASEGLAVASALSAAFFAETLRGEAGAMEGLRLAAGAELEAR